MSVETPHNIEGVQLNNMESRKRPLGGKVALVTEFSQDTSAEIAIWLSEKGAQIIGIVGNSRKEQEDAKKAAIHIDYRGGDIELVHKDIKITEDRKRLGARLGKLSGGKLDILVLNNLGTETNSTLLDEFLPCMNERGTIILVGQEDEAMESLRERVQIMPGFNRKEASFFIVCPPVERIEKVGKKSSRAFKRIV